MNDNQIRLRPSVIAFAKAMELTLRKHDKAKKGQLAWRNNAVKDLIDHADEELCEIHDAWNCGEYVHARVAEEAVDLANMAMMIWDNCLHLPDAKD